MRIAIVNPGICRSADGLQKIGAFVANGLAEKGHQVLLLHEGGGRPQLPLHPKIVLLECNPYCHHPAVAQKFAGFCAEVALPMLYNSSLWAYLELIGELPWVYTEHTNPQRVEQSAYHQGRTERLDAINLAWACHLFFHSYQQTIPREFHHKVHLIANPVPSVPSVPSVLMHSGRQDSTTRFRLVTAGRLEPNKNQTLLVDAFALLAEDFPNWDVYIFGRDGGDRKKLVQQIRRYGLKKRVFIEGFTTNLAAEFRQSHSCVLPSLFEGFPLVLTEAMAAGLAVVGLESCLGPTSLVHHGKTGLLAADHRPESMAHLLAQLMSSKKLRSRLGQAGREAMRAYAPDRIIDAYERMLLETTSKFQSNPQQYLEKQKMIRYYKLYHESVVYGRWLRFGKASKVQKLNMLLPLLTRKIP